MQLGVILAARQETNRQETIQVTLTSIEPKWRVFPLRPSEISIAKRSMNEHVDTTTTTTTSGQCNPYKGHNGCLPAIAIAKSLILPSFALLRLVSLARAEQRVGSELHTRAPLEYWLDISWFRRKLARIVVNFLAVIGPSLTFQHRAREVVATEASVRALATFEYHAGYIIK